MALDITINLNDEREATLARITAEFNRQSAPEGAQGDSLTSAQWLRQDVRRRIDEWTAVYAEQDKLNMRAAYRAASPEDRAAIDAILNKYR